MICYKDKTFCQFHVDCQDGPECHRALTKTVREAADLIELPIALWATPPECFRDEREGV